MEWIIVIGKYWLRKATENEHRTHLSLLAAKGLGVWGSGEGQIKQFTRLELRRKAFLKPQGRGNRW